MTACGGGDDSPAAADAAAPDAPLLAGDFSCVGVEWPATAPDPLGVAGEIFASDTGGAAGNVPFEIRAIEDDAVLAQGNTTNTVVSRGRYSATIPTGGQARRIYRKISAPGYLESYAVDPFPEHIEFSFASYVLDQGVASTLYEAAGSTYDAARGILLVQVLDCKLPSATGVHALVGATIDPPPGTKAVYLDADGNPAAGATATTSSGQVVLVGVMPGMADVTVHAGPITYRSWPVQVRADTFTWSPRHP